MILAFLTKGFLIASHGTLDGPTERRKESTEEHEPDWGGVEVQSISDRKENLTFLAEKDRFSLGTKLRSV